MWRCFHAPAERDGRRRVFSTHVEVFPEACTVGDDGTGLLHARGGVSGFLRFTGECRQSSPRPWMCFLDLVTSPELLEVFSTHVEVFPCRALWVRALFSLLHVQWRCFPPGGIGHTPGKVFSTHVKVF